MRCDAMRFYFVQFDVRFDVILCYFILFGLTRSFVLRPRAGGQLLNPSPAQDESVLFCCVCAPFESNQVGRVLGEISCVGACAPLLIYLQYCT